MRSYMPVIKIVLVVGVLFLSFLGPSFGPVPPSLPWKMKDDYRTGGVGNPILISNLSFSEAIAGSGAPQEVLDQLELISIKYWGIDSLCYIGQILVYDDYKKEVIEIFDTLFICEFPIEKMIPVSKYNWSDDSSMVDNNTSSFNYRSVLGTELLSKHSFGRAIDINPRLNPFVQRNGRVTPDGAIYNPEIPGTLSDTSLAVQLFKSQGWRWGGDWLHSKDYQHFEK